MTLPLLLGPELTIAQAAECRQQLLEHLAANSGPVQLDLSGVTDFDSSAAQWLLAAGHTARARGQSLQIVAASSAVCDALRRLGLLRWLPQH